MNKITKVIGKAIKIAVVDHGFMLLGFMFLVSGMIRPEGGVVLSGIGAILVAMNQALEYLREIIEIERVRRQERLQEKHRDTMNMMDSAAKSLDQIKYAIQNHQNTVA